MQITSRLAAAQAEEEKDEGHKDIKMSGVEYAAITPGDISPGAMNVDLQNGEETKEGETEGTEEVPVVDKRA